MQSIAQASTTIIVHIFIVIKELLIFMIAGHMVKMPKREEGRKI